MYKKNEFELKARAAEYMYIHHYKSQLSSKIQFILDFTKKHFLFYFVHFKILHKIVYRFLYLTMTSEYVWF